MLKVMDTIVGEESYHKSYMDAFEEAERRVMIHGQEFPYKHGGYHFAINCEMIENKNTRTIIVRQREDN